MNKLYQELKRLFFLPEQQEPSSELIAQTFAGTDTALLPLLGHEQQVRTLVIGVGQAEAWHAVAALYEGVQEQWGWPAPAVSVSPKAGFQIWFSLRDTVPADQAEHMLTVLKAQFLSDIPAWSLTQFPSAEAAPGAVPVVPAYDAAADRWSAFIDPSMGSMFADETGLEMSPNLSRQADLLNTVESITAEAFRRALGPRGEEGKLAGGCPPEQATEPRPTDSQLGEGQGSRDSGAAFTDPKAFLLEVMNDRNAGLADRIRAAEALLPYFERKAD